jgi:DNA gyrase subunit A
VTSYLLIVTECGHGKRIPVDAIPHTSRNRHGVTIRPVTVTVAGAVVVSIEDEVVIATKSGKVERIAVADVPVKDRRARGVRLVRLASGDQVTAAGKVAMMARPLRHNVASGHPTPDLDPNPSVDPFEP